MATIALDPHTMAAGVLSQDGVRRKLLVLLAWGKLHRCQSESAGRDLEDSNVRVLDQIAEWSATFPEWVPTDLELAASEALFDDAERRVTQGQRRNRSLAVNVRRVRLDALASYHVPMASSSGTISRPVDWLLHAAFQSAADVVVSDSAELFRDSPKRVKLTDPYSGNHVTAKTVSCFFVDDIAATEQQLSRLNGSLLAQACELCEAVDDLWGRF